MASTGTLLLLVVVVAVVALWNVTASKKISYALLFVGICIIGLYNSLLNASLFVN